MAKKKEKMEKCKTCMNLDRKMSNENWIVCPIMPMDVILSGDADKCKSYAELQCK